MFKFENICYTFFYNFLKFKLYYLKRCIEEIMNYLTFYKNIQFNFTARERTF